MPDGQRTTQSRRKRELLILALVFGVALGLRIAYLHQVSRAPFFHAPLGDSQVYLGRAEEILAGDILGTGIPFHSSPVYPYFIALALKIGGGSLGMLYGIQAVLGALNCVIIALLARTVAGGRSSATLIAGLMAGCYGLFAFFDGDVLMISSTLFFIDLALLLAIAARETGRRWTAAAAGVAFGLAALDKVNLLVCAPAVLLFLWSGLARRPAHREWKTPALFAAALALTILPVTARNWVVGGDLVLVSANGGVNLFIGNNPHAAGYFRLPPGSGLRDPGLPESSRAVASRALGRQARPSEASAYWAGRAWEFVVDQPLAAMAVLARKARLLLNAYEFPNHMNFYYVREEYAPVLRFMPVGFWLVLPLALGGMALSAGRASAPPTRLLLAFLLCYVASLLPFFICERYRLPAVPLLIVFAAVSVVGAYASLRERRLRSLLPWGCALAVGAAAASLPVDRVSYVSDRVEDAQGWHNVAVGDPARRSEMLARAAVALQWALEVDPGYVPAHFGLGLVLEAAGDLAESERELRQALTLDPSHVQARQALARMQARRPALQAGASMKAPLPPTPFQLARALEEAGRIPEAARRYRDLLSRDPFHAAARARLRRLETAEP